MYYKHQQGYLRNKLLAIKYLGEGKTRNEVAKLVGCTYKTLTTWIDQFLEGGLKAITFPIKHEVKQRLNPEQKQELKLIVLTEKPKDYGIDRQIWTAKILAQIIQEKWQVSLKDSRIYEILDELKLSHQKAHRDYANALPEQQQEFIETLKKKLINRQEKEKIVFFDEFSVSNRPTTFYAPSEKNSRPQVQSNEKGCRHKINGLLSVDVVTGEEYLSLKKQAKTEDIVSYFATLCDDCLSLGFQKLSIILDNNSTHKKK